MQTVVFLNTPMIGKKIVKCLYQCIIHVYAYIGSSVTLLQDDDKKASSGVATAMNQPVARFACRFQSANLPVYSANHVSRGLDS